LEWQKTHGKIGHGFFSGISHKESSGNPEKNREATIHPVIRILLSENPVIMCSPEKILFTGN
jgi:hypothetical protein